MKTGVCVYLSFSPFLKAKKTCFVTQRDSGLRAEGDPTLEKERVLSLSLTGKTSSGNVLQLQLHQRAVIIPDPGMWVAQPLSSFPRALHSDCAFNGTKASRLGLEASPQELRPCHPMSDEQPVPETSSAPPPLRSATSNASPARYPSPRTCQAQQTPSQRPRSSSTWRHCCATHFPRGSSEFRNRYFSVSLR